MLLKIALAAISIVAAGLAQAQQDAQDGAQQPAQETMAPPALVEVEDGNMVVEAFGLTVDELENRDVFTPGGEEVGDVESVLMTPEGDVVAVSAGVGGFLGIGERTVVIMLDQLAQDGERLELDMTAEEIGGLQQYLDTDDET